MIEIKAGDSYITTYGAILTIVSIASNIVSYTYSMSGGKIIGKDTVDIEVIVSLVKQDILKVNTLANRILYCRF